MIDEVEYIGYKKFVWFVGVVEDINDPVKVSRVRVRMLSLHTEDKALLPTENLPWATVMMPTTSASISGIGFSPSALVRGSWVVGFFLDGEEANQPLVIGSWHGIPETNADPNEGFNDPTGEYPSYVNKPDVHKNALGADVGLFANNANNLKTATANTSTRLETSITQDTPSEENASKKQLAKLGNVILNKPGSIKEPTVFETVKKSALSGGGFGLSSVTGALSGISGISSSLSGGLSDSISNIAGGEAFNALQGATDAVTSSLESVTGAISDVTGEFLDSVNTVTGEVTNALSGVTDSISGITEGLDSTVSDFASGLGGKLADNLDLSEKLSQSVSGVVADSSKNILDDVTGDVIGKIQTEVDLDTGQLTAVTDSFGNPLTTLNSIVDSDGNTINNLENVVLGSAPKDGASVLHTLDPVIEEPPSPVNSEYPHNKVYATTSGHLIELDDTPDAERIRIYHKAGTFIEVHPNGGIVNYHGNRWSITDGTDKLRVKGNVEVYVDGNATIESMGKVEVTGSEVAIGAAGKMKLTAGAFEVEAGSIKLNSKAGITSQSITHTIRAGKYNYRGGNYTVKAPIIKLN